MPHKCARCKKIYDDNAPELLTGCSCGARVFLFVKEEERRKKTGKKEIDDDLEWLDKELARKLETEDMTVHLDVENLLRLSKGKYRLNISSLMRGEPLVFKAKDGVYYIDIPYSMKKKKH